MTAPSFPDKTTFPGDQGAQASTLTSPISSLSPESADNLSHIYVSISPDNPVLPRLTPLYISSFFQGLTFWYAIEKIFMVHIGFTATTIAVAIMLASVVGLLVTIPAGLLADRWSRKGVLMIAVSLLGLSSLLYGLSTSVSQYLGVTILFAMYPTVHYSIMDAMFYDVLIGERNSRTGYEKFVGFSTSIYGIAMMLGALLGGVIATRFGLSAAYFTSVPSAALAVCALVFFKEPVAKLPMSSRLPSNLWRNLRSLLSNNLTLRVIVALVFCNIITDLLLDIAQLWPLALHVRTLLFGPLNALLLLGYSLGGPLSSLLLRKRSYVLIVSIIGLVCALLLTSHHIIVIAVAQFGMLCIFIALYTIALGKLQDNISSVVRSSISSTMSMLCSTVYLPFVLLFGFLVQRHTVFTAAWLILPAALIAVLSLYGTLAGHGSNVSG